MVQLERITFVMKIEGVVIYVLFERGILMENPY
jgi:hypothetical protein